MAKHVILENYTFTPASRTVTVSGKNIRREQLLLITNVTTGTVIYNFSDPSLGAATFTNSVSTINGTETTTIVLSYITSAMSSTDKLSILVEETYTEITPAETSLDPVGKLRVSTPQSMIDTDFEYGTQPTKWESINLLDNRPSAFYDATVPVPGVTNVTASGTTVTVSLPATAGYVVGQPIFIQGTLDPNADGWWLIAAVTLNTSFTYITTTAPAAALFDSTKTYVYGATFYTGAGIPAATNAIVLNGTVATVTTTNAHGLQVGNSIYVVGATGMTGTLNGSWIIATTPTSNSFTFACTATGTITTVLNASIYPRSLGYLIHRPFDGGVQFTNVSPYHGYQVIRQTRRYFRYQSGKGIQFSTGSILKPAIATQGITSSGTTVTVTTSFIHGVLPGAVIQVAGCIETAYNGNFTVVSTPTPRTFTYTAGSTPSAATATGFPIRVSPFSWYGSKNRIGMFDQQNGAFFEFDGQTLYLVKRSSTQQLSGTSAVTLGSPIITGSGTKYSTQLTPGNYIVIRGQSYLVQSIISDTSLVVCPEYRGSTAAAATVSVTIDTKYAQSTWNIDKCDGTGASGYNVDLTQMQMFYIDYSWYGAGAIRFGFKNNRGEIVYSHRIVNNNLNTEAWMRSGNMCGRYETNTLAPFTNMTATVASNATTGATISVLDTTGWPNAGTVVINASGNTGAAIEYITYSAKTQTSVTIAARAQTGGAVAAQTFTYSATAPTQVSLYAPQCASTISHWGSSVIMDGRYDDDKSLVFVAGQSTAASNIGAGATVPLISLRCAPSVDNGLTGLLGQRELINRMQLVLRGMGVFTTGASMTFLITLRLNAKVSSGNFAPVGGSSLSQVAYHNGSGVVTGGEIIYGFFTTTPGVTTEDLALVRDMGTSILGGGTALTYPNTDNNKYPDGPDIVTVCATNVTAVATNTINARISWTEAQA